MNQKELINLGYQTLKSINKNLRKNDLPQELLVGGIKNNGVWYPPDTIKKIKEYLKLPKSEKYKRTCLKKYNVDNVSKIKEIQNKKENTLFKHYGTKKSFELPQFKNSIKEKYGVDNISQNDNIKNKKKKTLFKNYKVSSTFYLDSYKNTIKKKYGVDNISQNSSIKIKKRKGLGKKYYYDNNSFDSTWELAFYFYLKSNGIDFIYQPTDKQFTYTVNGKQHNYFPDFKVNEHYIEIKGDHFFSNGKLIDPYSKDRESQIIAEAKFDCMKKNDIIILKEKELEKYIDFATEKLGDLYKFNKRNK